MAQQDHIRIAVIGLGYVGLPLAVEFGRQLPVCGFDIDATRIAELGRGVDRTAECSGDELATAAQLRFSSDPAALADANVYIVTVPTPIDAHKRPNLAPLEAASRSVGQVLAPGDLVIYESTVYPGATEEVCVPVLEQASGLVLNADFFVGYSPERINPGDREHRLPTICKVTSGSCEEAAERVDALYRRIITAGTHRAPSIRVAEAAKVIENTQRDVNIALVNELAVLFGRLGIDTLDVLEAAGTKWNFLPFRPGLVGGHCIGVDPYYLADKAQAIGFHPEMILAGRRINDAVGEHVADELVHLMTRRKIHVVGSRVLVLGFTFKEDCPDVRNTHVIDIVRRLQSYNAQVDVYDPCAGNGGAIAREYGIEPMAQAPAAAYDAVVLAVAHAPFRQMSADDLQRLRKPESVVFDVKSMWPRDWVDARL